MEYHKLVRDRIPHIIQQKGQTAITAVLSDREYALRLEEKLDEEVAEFHESKDLEELADILEVVYALSEAGGHPVSELQAVYQRKHQERGGFAKKIFLRSVEEPATSK